MAAEMRRRGDELDVELAPSKRLINCSLSPYFLNNSHYIRTSSDTTISALNEFLMHLANQTSGSVPNQLTDSNTTDHVESNLCRNSNINQFYIDRRHRLCKIDPSENLANIFFNSINWDKHLIIFFDLKSSNESSLELNEIIGEELATLECSQANIFDSLGEKVEFDLPEDLPVFDTKSLGARSVSTLFRSDEHLSSKKEAPKILYVPNESEIREQPKLDSCGFEDKSKNGVVSSPIIPSVEAVSLPQIQAPPPPPPLPPASQQAKAISGRSDLMAAIRATGGVKGAGLKSVKIDDKQLENSNNKKNVDEEDLMTSLTRVLAMRRKGISGRQNFSGRQKTKLSQLLIRKNQVISVIDSQFSSSDAFFAVFDGHNGSDCSAYASAHFLECLLDARSSGSSEESLLEDAFIRMDTRLTNRCFSENYKSGTTVSCIYLKDRKIAYMAWCGDSSIALLKERRIETLSIPHKPDNPEERNRIEEAGGMVINVQGVPRLNGVLNLSRSLGDIRAKPMISSKPDLSTYSLSENEVDYMIFLSTDGIWDCLEEEQIFELVRIFVTEHSIKDFYLLADFIAAKAKEADSVDNMTLICVCLESLEEIWDTFAYKMEDRPLSKSC